MGDRGAGCLHSRHRRSGRSLAAWRRSERTWAPLLSSATVSISLGAALPNPGAPACAVLATCNNKGLSHASVCVWRGGLHQGAPQEGCLMCSQRVPKLHCISCLPLQCFPSLEGGKLRPPRAKPKTLWRPNQSPRLPLASCHDLRLKWPRVSSPDLSVFSTPAGVQALRSESLLFVVRDGFCEPLLEGNFQKTSSH